MSEKEAFAHMQCMILKFYFIHCICIYFVNIGRNRAYKGGNGNRCGIDCPRFRRRFRPLLSSNSAVKIAFCFFLNTRVTGSAIGLFPRSTFRGVLTRPSFRLQQIRIPFIMGKGPDSATNTSCYVQVLGVGTDTGCTVPSALLFFDRQRYLFNVGEGFQRFCVEHRIKLSKISSILATRVTTEATGGLPGMLLTMADTTAGGLLTGHAQLTVHGPPGLHTLVNGFRTFVNVKDLGLKVAEFGTGSSNRPRKNPPIMPAPNVTNSESAEQKTSVLPQAEIVTRSVVKNESVAITPIVLRPAGETSNEESRAKRLKLEGNGDLKEDGAQTQTSVAADAQKKSSIDVDSVNYESAVACYACELPDIPGKFLPQKAASFGVPRGPLYGQLARGQEVTAVNGQIVKPEDVMEASTPGPIIIIVDCPSRSFLPSLTNKEAGVAFWGSDSSKRGRGKPLGCNCKVGDGQVVGCEREDRNANT